MILANLERSVPDGQDASGQKFVIVSSPVPTSDVLYVPAATSAVIEALAVPTFWPAIVRGPITVAAPPNVYAPVR